MEKRNPLIPAGFPDRSLVTKSATPFQLFRLYTTTTTTTTNTTTITTTTTTTTTITTTTITTTTNTTITTTTTTTTTTAAASTSTTTTTITTTTTTTTTTNIRAVAYYTNIKFTLVYFLLVSVVHYPCGLFLPFCFLLSFISVIRILTC